MRPTQNVTKLIDDLERTGLVTKSREVGDRRMVSVAITSDGLLYVERSIRTTKSIDKGIVSILDEAGLGTIEGIVRKVRNHLSDQVKGNGKRTVPGNRKKRK